ncbi:MAG: DEAD/DEAH box helicase [Bdellovibrionaceae bacterium]|jgi:ATP-dependent RNA helicase RhlB|nr:DEAD/DEAH box helicase [Pseudobdellovibrionaceae bacterium]
MDSINLADYPLDEILKKNLSDMGVTQLRPVQQAVWSLVIQGRDVAVQADTGSGKTLAFLVPLVDRVLKAMRGEGGFGEWRPRQFVLILVPTRELGQQIQEVFAKVTTHTSLQSVLLIGGESIDQQKQLLSSGPQFIVATPGRLIDLYKSHALDLKQVRALVIDEADRFAEIGFERDLRFLARRLPKERQWLVFSATLSYDILYLSYDCGAEVEEVRLSSDTVYKAQVKDYVIHLGEAEKPQYLLSLIKNSTSQQIIVFTNFKNQVEWIATFLRRNQILALPISGQMPQNLRRRALEEFRRASQQIVLVATDVAARGLDIQGVDLVIHYELPTFSETYVHRMGRAGRSGREGLSYALADDRDVDALQKIEKYLSRKIDIGHLEDEQLIKDFVPASEIQAMAYQEFYKKLSSPQARMGSKPSSKGRQSQPAKKQESLSRSTSVDATTAHGERVHHRRSREEFRTSGRRGAWDKKQGRGSGSMESGRRGQYRSERSREHTKPISRGAPEAGASAKTEGLLSKVKKTLFGWLGK